jgi:hypothetical protein
MQNEEIMAQSFLIVEMGVLGSKAIFSPKGEYSTQKVNPNRLATFALISLCANFSDRPVFLELIS